jgi:hypothetical protein
MLNIEDKISNIINTDLNLKKQKLKIDNNITLKKFRLGLNKKKEEEENEENKKDNENNNMNKQEYPNQNQEQDQDPLLSDPYATTTYILKYKRSKQELKEVAIETNLPKTENCLFMLNIKILKSNNLSEAADQNSEAPHNFLVICCHEIAAIYFDEIYERIYTLEDLYNENIFFKVFDQVEEARNIIDESIKNNEKNEKKVFINLKDKELKLHMRLSFFDKEKEIIFNIPKKILTDQDKNNLLPEFLKEIQDKMNHLKEENKKLKEKKLITDNNLAVSDFLIETDIKKEPEVKSKPAEENNEIKEKNNNEEAKSVKKKIIKKKIKKKTVKEQAKKVILPEENFF